MVENFTIFIDLILYLHKKNMILFHLSMIILGEKYLCRKK